MGGGVNFVAVKESFDVAPEASNPLIVADNFVMAGLSPSPSSSSPWLA